MVMTGRALFEVGDERLDMPAGTMLVVEPGTVRSATAGEPGTTVLVVGGRPGDGLPVSPFEYWYAAVPAQEAGDYDGAFEIAAEGLKDWPDHGTLHYALACYRALSGRHDEALSHLRGRVRARSAHARLGGRRFRSGRASRPPGLSGVADCSGSIFSAVMAAAPTRGAVVITGASTGIGHASALHLASLGFQVFAGVRREEDAERLRAAGNGSIEPVHDRRHRSGLDRRRCRPCARGDRRPHRRPREQRRDRGAGTARAPADGRVPPADRGQPHRSGRGHAGIPADAAPSPRADREHRLDRRPGRAAAARALRGVEARDGGADRLAAAGAAPRRASRSRSSGPGPIATEIWERGNTKADELLERMPEARGALRRRRSPPPAPGPASA